MPGESSRLPTLEVRDKGKIRTGQSVNWVIPADSILLLDRATAAAEFAAEVAEVRHLGEITLATLQLADLPGTRLRVTLAGPAGAPLKPAARQWVRLDPGLIHVMPRRTN